MSEISLGGVGIGALVAVLVGLAKQFGISSRILPVLSLVLGAALGTIAYFVGEMTITTSIISGALIGVATSGTYDVVKTSILGK